MHIYLEVPAHTKHNYHRSVLGIRKHRQHTQDLRTDFSVNQLIKGAFICPFLCKKRDPAGGSILTIYIFIQKKRNFQGPRTKDHGQHRDIRREH